KPRIPSLFFAAALLFCLAAWVLLFVNPSRHLTYSFFSMLAVAGVLGTLLRSSLRLIFDAGSTFSWIELLLELGAGLVLSFALALLHLFGAFTITGKTDAILIPSTDAGFQRVGVIMTLLGLGAGLMLEQTAEGVRQKIATMSE